MKKIFSILAVFTVLISFNSCTEEVEPPQTNYITFGATTYSTGVDVKGSKTFDIPVYTANVTGSDRAFEVAVLPTSTAAAGSYTVPSTVTIPAGTNIGTLSVALTDTNLGIGVNALRLSFGPQDGLSRGPDTVLNYIQNCTEVTASLTLTFDLYAEETGWNIKDELGGVVASKAAGSYTRGQGPATESIQLCAGRNYTLTVTDAFNDGMNDGAFIGNYRLVIGGVTKVMASGNFTSSQTNAFNTN